MTLRCHSQRPGESGFVLIGVVIFVLALTIIGISLFSLSIYEAQFLQRSIDREQAFQSAAGCGLERARFVLTLPGDMLDSVQTSLPPGVVRTVAIQGEDSTGAVDWGINADSVLIRVTAGRVGTQRVVEAYFRPVLTSNYYSSLITVSEGIEVEHESPVAPEERDHTVLFDGPVWESSGHNPNHWLHRLMLPEPVDIRQSPAVPLPDVALFLRTGRSDHPGRERDSRDPALLHSQQRPERELLLQLIPPPRLHDPGAGAGGLATAERCLVQPGHGDLGRSGHGLPGRDCGANDRGARADRS
jgi:hypothetical protein